MRQEEPTLKTIGFTIANPSMEICTEDAYVAAELEKQGCRVIPLHWQKPLPRKEALWILFRSHWNYPRYYTKFLSWLDLLEVQGYQTMNPIPLVRWNSSKSYLWDLAQKGFRMPRMQILCGKDPSPEMLQDLASNDFVSKDLVVKPLIGASGCGVQKLSQTQLFSWWKDLDILEKEKGWLLQNYEAGIQKGEYSVIFFDGQYAHTVHKTPQKDEFRVNSQFQGKLKRMDPPPQILEVAQQVIKSLDTVPVYARVDLIQNEEGEGLLLEFEVNEPSLYFSLAP